MNTELVLMALQACRKYNELASHVRPPKLDSTGLVIPQVSLFLRDKENPHKDSLAIKFLAESGLEISIAETSDTRYVLSARGICKIVGEKPELAPFREAISAFCGSHGKPPEEFVPFLESQVEYLARQVLMHMQP